MTPCHVVDIVTPKKFLLRGLWFGPSFAKATKDKPKKAKRTFIFIHGWSGSAFSMRPLLEQLIDSRTAVLSFNNRGFEFVTTIRSAKKLSKERLKGGAAHEIFEECTDDIEGAIRFARKMGGRDVFLIGHSTGCQKSIYWAGKKGKGKDVRGIVLLAPVSDWAAETKRQGHAKVARATRAARILFRQGKKHELLPKNVWHETIDAQRFLSMYDPGSPEEIFSYAQPKKIPKTLRAIKKPILVFWAGKDEFAKDESSRRIQEWFLGNLKQGTFSLQRRAGHGFKGAEGNVVQTIHQWVKKL